MWGVLNPCPTLTSDHILLQAPHLLGLLGRRRTCHVTGQEQARPAWPASCFSAGIPPVDRGPRPVLCLWNPGSGQRLRLSQGGPSIQVYEGSRFCPCRASHLEGRGCLKAEGQILLGSFFGMGIQHEVGVLF